MPDRPRPPSPGYHHGAPVRGDAPTVPEQQRIVTDSKTIGEIVAREVGRRLSGTVPATTPPPSLIPRAEPPQAPEKNPNLTTGQHTQQLSAAAMAASSQAVTTANAAAATVENQAALQATANEAMRTAVIAEVKAALVGVGPMVVETLKGSLRNVTAVLSLGALVGSAGAAYVATRKANADSAPAVAKEVVDTAKREAVAPASTVVVDHYFVTHEPPVIPSAAPSATPTRKP